MVPGYFGHTKLQLLCFQPFRDRTCHVCKIWRIHLVRNFQVDKDMENQALERSVHHNSNMQGPVLLMENDRLPVSVNTNHNFNTVSLFSFKIMCV